MAFSRRKFSKALFFFGLSGCDWNLLTSQA